MTSAATYPRLRFEFWLTRPVVIAVVAPSPGPLPTGPYTLRPAIGTDNALPRAAQLVLAEDLDKSLGRFAYRRFVAALPDPVEGSGSVSRVCTASMIVLGTYGER